MAGLQQYYFFPTDFFYPRPARTTSDAASKAAVIPAQALKDDYANPVKASDHSNPNAVPAAAPRLAISGSAIKKELNSRIPIIAEPKKFSDHRQAEE